MSINRIAKYEVKADEAIKTLLEENKNEFEKHGINPVYSGIIRVGEAGNPDYSSMVEFTLSGSDKKFIFTLFNGTEEHVPKSHIYGVLKDRLGDFFKELD